MRKLKIYFYLSIVSSNVLFAYPWPFDKATTNQQLDRQNIGGFRRNLDGTLAGGAFHNGLDVEPNPPDAAATVFCIQDGINLGIQHAGEDTEGIRIGNIVYIHIRVFPDIPVDNLQSVAVGTAIGVLEPEDHVHLIEGPQQGTKSNPLFSIHNFVDNTAPTITNFSIYQDPQNKDVDFTNTPTIYGKLDFRVEGYDQMDQQYQSTDYLGRLMPYQMGYQILGSIAGAPAILYDRYTIPNETILFDAVPPSTNHAVTIIHDSPVGASPAYWITNQTHGGALPTLSFWNSKQIKGQSISIDAPINAQAQIPDGTITILAIIGDTKGNSATVSSEKIIDNFMPYVQGVSMAQGNNLYLNENWPLTADSPTILHNSFSYSFVSPLEYSDNLSTSASVSFSETMKSNIFPSVFINPPGRAVMVNHQWLNNGQMETVNFDSSDFLGYVGPVTFQIGEWNTLDLAGNQINPMPQTIAIRNGNGQWINSVSQQLISHGPDQNFSFIEAGLPYVENVSVLSGNTLEYS